MSKNTHETGTEIRVIAPSYRREPGDKQRNERAAQRLGSYGYTVTFGRHIDANYQLGTAEASDRVTDLHEAFTDPNVKIVMAHSGGWSANELLPLIDWELVRMNSKPLIGFSDITVLLNAIYAKTGIVSYLGPNFGSFGLANSWQYTLDVFDAVMRQEMPLELKPSTMWGEATGDQYPTQGLQVLQEGEAEAILLGGNFNTFHLLQGTEYQPAFSQPFILVAEDDDESGELTARYFSRGLESILQLPNVRKNLKGIVIGRFLPASKFSLATLAGIIASKQLGSIPVVAEADFGHTMPILTLPIGGTLRVLAKHNYVVMHLVSV